MFTQCHVWKQYQVRMYRKRPWSGLPIEIAYSCGTALWKKDGLCHDIITSWRPIMSTGIRLQTWVLKKYHDCKVDEQNGLLTSEYSQARSSRMTTRTLSPRFVSLFTTAYRISIYETIITFNDFLWRYIPFFQNNNSYRSYLDLNNLLDITNTLRPNKRSTAINLL